MLPTPAVADYEPSILDAHAGLSQRDGSSIHINSPGASKSRRELRYPVHLPAVVRTASSDSPVNVRICDMSSFGLGLNLPIEIKPGTIVEIDFAYGIVIGEMIHCQSVTGYFRAGLAVREFIRRENSNK